jgi:hypothetical protein
LISPCSLTLSLVLEIASNSSIKSIAFSFLAFAKILSRFFEVSHNLEEIRFARLTIKSFFPSSPAIQYALNVFPVQGGQYKSSLEVIGKLNFLILSISFFSFTNRLITSFCSGLSTMFLKLNSDSVIS